MKQLFSHLFCLLCSLVIFGQNDPMMVDMQKAGFQDTLDNICADKNLPYYKYFGNFGCYDGNPVVMIKDYVGKDNVKAIDGTYFSAKADLQRGEGTSSEIMAGGIQPLGWGYHVLKMDPFNPQNRGTKGSEAIFVIRLENLNKANENLYYHDKSEGFNVPKYLFFDSNSTTKSEKGTWASNSARALSKSNTYSFGVNASFGGFEASNNTSFKKQVDEAVTKKLMYAEEKDHKIHGTWKITEFAVMTKGFLDALYDLPIAFQASDFKSKWEPFFDTYGTHYAVSTDYGARKMTVSKVSASGVKKSIEKNTSIKHSATVPIDPTGKATVGASFGFESGTKSENEKDKSAALSKSVEVGSLNGESVKTAAPVAVDLRPVSILCRAFQLDQDTKWKKTEKAINDALAHMLSEHKKSGAKYFSDKPFITQADLNQATSTGSNSEGDPTVRTVYIKPTQIKYHTEPENGTCEMRYSVKVKAGSGKHKKYGVFGFEKDIEDGTTITAFDNLKSDLLKLGDFKGNEEINVKFDSWENDVGGDWTYDTGNITDNDDEYPDASIDIRLNGTKEVKGVAKISQYEVHFTVFQK